jgi:hypothetical protein
MTEPSIAHLFLSDEFLPIIDRLHGLTVVEPPQKLQPHRLGNLRPRYVELSPDTALPLPDASFDLLLPERVAPPEGFVQVRELARVPSLRGHMLVLKPVVSLGNWSGRWYAT